MVISAAAHAAADTSALISTPMERHISAFAVQSSKVSIYTESVCTSPCLAGYETLADADALGADPTPDSFKYRPLLIP